MVALQRDIKAWIQRPDVIASISAALPQHLTGEKFAKVVLTACNKNPKLLECSKDSLMLAMLQSAALGLEPDGRHAHIIPYNSRNGMQAQLQLDYKGIVQLVRRSGEIGDIHCDVVRRGDLFTYKFGRVEDHIPWFLRDDPKKPAAPGAIYAIYSRVVMKDGSLSCDVMSVEEVNQIRDGRSQGYRQAKQYGKTHPWDDEEKGGSYCEMAKKTAFKRHSKWLPVSYELAEALAKEDEAEDTLQVDLAESAEVAAARPKPPPKKKGAAAMETAAPATPPADPTAAAAEAAKPVTATEPAKTVEPAPAEQPQSPPAPPPPAPPPPAPEAEGKKLDEPTATHDLVAYRKVTARNTDGTAKQIIACDLKADDRTTTAYYEGTEETVPPLGWVAVTIEERPHSTKPDVKVPFIKSISAALPPEF